MIVGRMVWDFVYLEEGGKDWGMFLFDLDVMKYVMFMVLECCLWWLNE